MLESWVDASLRSWRLNSSRRMDMVGMCKGMEEEPARVRAKPQPRQSHG